MTSKVEEERAKVIQLVAPFAPGELYSLFTATAEIDETNGMATSSKANEDRGVEQESAKKGVEVAPPVAPGHCSLFNVTAKTDEKSARQLIESSTASMEEHDVLDISCENDEETAEPDVVEVAGIVTNSHTEEQQLSAARSHSNDAIDDTNAPPMLVKADLAPEVTPADEVNIQHEEDMLNKKIEYRRILSGAMVFYGIAILFNIKGFIQLISDGTYYGETYYDPVYLFMPAGCLLFLATLLMVLPTRSFCSSIRLQDYAPDDEQRLREAQRVSAASSCLFWFAVFPIISSLRNRLWLGYAFQTWVFAGTVFALSRVRFLLRSVESRQEKSKVFWVSLVVFFLALCGVTVWNGLTYIDKSCTSETCDDDTGECFIYYIPPKILIDGGVECDYTRGVSSKQYPDCYVESPHIIGDGQCDGRLYMTAECAFDGGDCVEFMDKFPGCIVDEPYKIGDGYCDGGPYMTVECGYDGGDCLALAEKYPDCHVDEPYRIGDGFCDLCSFDGHNCWGCGPRVRVTCMFGDYNTKACGYDGGDCDAVNKWYPELYPDCHVEKRSRIGDGVCDGRLYGTVECGFDGGDCLKDGERCRGHFECASEICNHVTKVCDSGFVSEVYPNCNVGMPHWIGDGKCDGGDYASEACGFDGGDCPER